MGRQRERSATGHSCLRDWHDQVSPCTIDRARSLGAGARQRETGAKASCEGQEH